MQKEFEQVKSLLEKSQRILLTMHERMDGDDGGSVLALAWQLRKTGKQVTCAIKRGVPPQLAFLPGSELITDDITHGNFDATVFFGCSVPERCGSKNILQLGTLRINIDHHPDNILYGAANVVDPAKSAVAELVYDLFVWAKWPIGKEVATCLLTGLVTDTGSFMHSNTTPSALKAAAELMKKGANLNRILSQTYKNKTPRTLKAWGKAMDNAYYDQKRKIIYAAITEKDLKELGGVPEAAFEGFVETLNTVPEAKFALFLKQDGEKIKGSLRSESFKNIDVRKIAKIFGGGGHKLAAGFSVLGKLVKEKDGGWKVV